MKQTWLHLICGILYLKLFGIGAINEITKLFIYIAGRVIKRLGQLLFVFLEKPLYKVCLIRIKEQVRNRRSTVCTHRYADCLLKNMSTNKFLDYSKSHFSDMTIIEIDKIIPTAFTPYTTCPKKNRKHGVVAW